MARKSRPTFKKRQKEIARQQKARDKMARRMARKEQSEHAPAFAGEEDPDIAGIRPGPQPLPEEWNYVPDRVPQAPDSDARQQGADHKGEGDS